MVRVLSDIHDINTSYTLDRVDCFEQVIAIVTNWINPGYDGLFLIYRKLYLSYDCGIENQEDVFYDFSKATGVICKKVGIDHDHNLEQEIIRILEKGNPVTVPINLKMIYYSQKYRKEDWPHLLLIKGYDSERRIFYILDSTQQQNIDDQTPNYVDFTITYEMLVQAFEGYTKMRNNYIYYFERSEETITKRQCIIDCITMFSEVARNRQIIEELLVEKQDLWNTAYLEFLLRFPKYRSIAMNIIIQYLKEYHINIDGLKGLADVITEEWQRYNLLFVRGIMKSGFKTLHYELPNQMKEDMTAFIEKLTEAREILQTMVSMDEVEDPLKCVNNGDHIISCVNDQYTFDFHTGKVYNTWLRDHCPKVILLDHENELKSVHVNASFQVDLNDKIEGYQAGIYIRTNYNLYTLGIDHENIFRFDFVGKYTIAQFELPSEKREFFIYVQIENGSITYGLVQDNQYIEFGKNEFAGRTIELGLFCKTWDNCKELKIVFDQVQMYTGENNLPKYSSHQYS